MERVVEGRARLKGILLCGVAKGGGGDAKLASIIIGMLASPPPLFIAVSERQIHIM